MKHLSLLIIMIASGALWSQEFGININYQLISASEWNRATQTYNFSRPFLPNKQPLLKHGANVSLYYLGSPEKTWSFGPAVSLSIHRSHAENPNFDIGINSLLLDLGWRIQYRPEEENLFLAITPSVTGVALNRTQNGEVVVIGPDEEDLTLRGFGIGAGLRAQIGYDFPIKNEWFIAPVLGASYHPYVWAQRSNIIFSESATGGLQTNTSTWGLQGGVILQRTRN